MAIPVAYEIPLKYIYLLMFTYVIISAIKLNES